MVARNLLLVDVNERASADDIFDADEQPVDAVRPGEDEVRDEVVGSAELQAVCPPDREIGSLSGLDKTREFMASRC